MNAAISNFDMLQVLLRHRETHVTAEGTLCALDHDNLKKAQATWTAEFQRRLEAGKRSEDSIFWERGILSPTTFSMHGALSGHVLLSRERVEGIVLMERQPFESWRCPQVSLTYVRYLATAPWNRDGAIPETGFYGIGRLLVARAVLDSIARGHDGRIALHSLTAATPFYSSLGFDCLGPDLLRGGMERFELPVQSVVLALAEIGAHLTKNPRNN